MSKKEIRIAFYGGIADVYLFPFFSLSTLLEKRQVIVDYESPDLLIFDANHEWREGYKRYPKVASVMFSGENITLFPYMYYLYPLWYFVRLYKVIVRVLQLSLPPRIRQMLLFRILQTWSVCFIRWMYRHSTPYWFIEKVRRFRAWYRARVGLRYLGFVNRRLMLKYRDRRVAYIWQCCRQHGPGCVVTTNALALGVKGVSLPYALPVIKLFEKKGLTLDNPLPFSAQRPYFAVSVVSNFHSLDRMVVYYRLSNYRKIHLAGRVGEGRLRGHPALMPTLMYKMAAQKGIFIPPLPPNWPELVPYYSQYKFVLCFENSFAEDYITEKLLMALLSGAIPIYRGAPNVGDYFNTERFICYEGSYQKMIAQVKALDQDDQAYEAFCARPIVTDRNKQFHARKWHHLSEYFRIMLKELNV